MLKRMPGDRGEQHAWLRRFVLTVAIPCSLAVVAVSARADDRPERRPPQQNYDDGKDRPSEPQSRPIGADRGKAEWRHPVAVALSADDRCLCVANRRTATLMVIDLSGNNAATTHEIGGRLEAMVRLSDGRLAIADSLNNRIVLLQLDGAKLVGKKEIPVGDEPRQLVAAHAGSTLWVSLRSEHAVQAVDTESLRLLYSQELDFPPHCLAVSQDDRTLLVADAFRGQVAALDARSGQILALRTFPGTNIRGLAFEPGDASFIFAHQIVSENSIIDRELVRWGAFITNNVRRVTMDVLGNPSVDVVGRSQLLFVGDFGNGAGDPGRLLIASGDLALLCLSGVNEIAIDTHWPYRMSRLDVGRRPVDVAVDSARGRAYIANQFDDSISVLDIARREVVQTISLGPLPQATAAMRGEMLFHDASLSLDNWYSCQSCHTDGQSNGANADTFGDGGHGFPKNTPSLLGVAQTKPWSWTGRFETLTDQIDSTLEHTMQSRLTSSSKSADLAAYLSTLEERAASQSLARSDREIVERGRDVFTRLGCVECHAGKSLTTEGVFDVGLDDGMGGHKEFNPPSLRGVWHTAPYFHDGRAKSLEDAVRGHPRRGDVPIDEADVRPLLAYLKSL